MRRGRRGGMFWVFILLLLLMAAMCSCDKAPINSDIEGHWRVLSIQNTNGEEQPCKNLFYSIQLWLVELEQKPKTENYGHFLGKFEYLEDGSLRMHSFLQSIGVADNGKEATEEDLRPYGLPSLDNRLEIIKANGKELVLRTDSTTIRMKRF